MITTTLDKCLILSSISQVQSFSLSLYWTFTNLTVLFLNFFPSLTTTRTGCLTKVRSSSTIKSSSAVIAIVFSGSCTYFLRWETWNTLWSPAKILGNFTQYVSFSILSITRNGPTYLDANFLGFPNHSTTFNDDTLIKTWSPTENSRSLRLLSA